MPPTVLTHEPSDNLAVPGALMTKDEKEYRRLVQITPACARMLKAAYRHTQQGFTAKELGGRFDTATTLLHRGWFQWFRSPMPPFDRFELTSLGRETARFI